MEGLAHNGFTMPIEETTARRLAALTLLLASLIYLPAAAGEPASNTITVVYNHVRTDSATDLQRGGGFGAFVEFNGRVILFDTGGQADILLHNLQELKKDALKIEAVVISHNHWDHVYGLPGVMSARGMSASAGERPTVYVPLSTRDAILQQNPRAAVVAVDSPTEIMPGAWLIGPLKLEYRGMPFAEQALVIEHEDGLVVLVRRSCSSGEAFIFAACRGMRSAESHRHCGNTVSSRLLPPTAQVTSPSTCSGRSGATSTIHSISEISSPSDQAYRVTPLQRAKHQTD
jgi:hypothetical protein